MITGTTFPRQASLLEVVKACGEAGNVEAWRNAWCRADEARPKQARPSAEDLQAQLDEALDQAGRIDVSDRIGLALERLGSDQPLSVSAPSRPWPRSRPPSLGNVPASHRSSARTCAVRRPAPGRMPTAPTCCQRCGLAARPGHQLVYSAGWALGEREKTALRLVPREAWQIAIDARGEVRERRADDACPDGTCAHRACWIEEAHVTELTGLLREGPGGDRLHAWPASAAHHRRRTATPDSWR